MFQILHLFQRDVVYLKVSRSVQSNCWKSCAYILVFDVHNLHSISCIASSVTHGWFSSILSFIILRESLRTQTHGLRWCFYREFEISDLFSTKLFSDFIQCTFLLLSVAFWSLFATHPNSFPDFCSSALVLIVCLFVYHPT